MPIQHRGRARPIRPRRRRNVNHGAERGGDEDVEPHEEGAEEAGAIEEGVAVALEVGDVVGEGGEVQGAELGGEEEGPRVGSVGGF